MKKLLSFMMLMMLMSFSFTSCSDDDDNNDVEVPQTVEQAKAMLMGQWQYPQGDPEEGIEEMYEEYGKDGKYYLIYKVAEDARDGYWYSKYKGQYVGYVESDTYSFEPDENDPTQGIIRLSETTYWGYSGLKKNEVYQVGERYTRPAKHISYKVVDWSL